LAIVHHCYRGREKKKGSELIPLSFPDGRGPARHGPRGGTFFTTLFYQVERKKKISPRRGGSHVVGKPPERKRLLVEGRGRERTFPTGRGRGKKNPLFPSGGSLRH